MEGTWSMPRSKVIQTKYGINHTTPGAIAGAMVLVSILAAIQPQVSNTPTHRPVGHSLRTKN